MATITAFILIGTADQNHSGIIPTHYIALYEGDHPSLSLYKFDNSKEIIRIKPAVEKLVDNIYLLIHTFILKAEVNSINTLNGKEIHNLYNDRRKKITYEQIMENLKTYDLKVVFNILAGSTLLNQLDRIKDYPNDFEVTTPEFRKEYNNRTGKVEFIEF
ncbi:MAG: hypothetical protein LBI04_07190 [Treponema sp.]|jgi:hypothetical protein|nr:hypothetical protein [Treponema sp.]